MLIPPLLGAAVGGTAFVVGLHLLGPGAGPASTRRERRVGITLVLLGLVLAASPFRAPDATALGALQVLAVRSWLVWFVRERRPVTGQSSSRSAEMNAS